MKIILVVVVTILDYGKENDDKDKNRAGGQVCFIVSIFDLLLRVFMHDYYAGHLHKLFDLLFFVVVISG